MRSTIAILILLASVAIAEANTNTIVVSEGAVIPFEKTISFATADGAVGTVVGGIVGDLSGFSVEEVLSTQLFEAGEVRMDFGPPVDTTTGGVVAKRYERGSRIVLAFGPEAIAMADRVMMTTPGGIDPCWACFDVYRSARVLYGPSGEFVALLCDGGNDGVCYEVICMCLCPPNLCGEDGVGTDPWDAPVERFGPSLQR